MIGYLLTVNKAHVGVMLMTPVFTVEQIVALAPDEASAKAGRGLASKRKWLALGCHEQAVWGECQGSGQNPYQTEVDLSAPAFRCSCPSRKFPCKHGLGLLLLLTEDPGAFNQTTPPARVTEWLTNRAEKQAKKAAKVENPTPEKSSKEVSDPAAQLKRQSEREQKVDHGLNDLSRWLFDMINEGLAAVQGRPYSYWDNQAARLVDAQAPGLARMLREIGGIASSGVDWQTRLLTRLSRLYLLVKAYQNLETLPEALQADIRAMIGFPQPTRELLEQQGIKDRWYLLGQIIEEDNYGVSPLQVRRTWLIGAESKRLAMILNFASSWQPFEVIPPINSWIDAELVFYPAAYPLRALIKAHKNAASQPITELSSYHSINAALESYTAALTLNPWLNRFPLLLKDIVPLRAEPDGAWSIVDQAGHYLPIAPSYQNGWQLMAASGGYPIDIFAEWEGEYLLPISILKKNGR